MQIVIDISEETYNEVYWRGLSLCPRDEEELVKAIKKGIPLDKIRTEIDAKREKLKIMADDDWCAGKIRGYDCAIEIIDKYGGRK